MAVPTTGSFAMFGTGSSTTIAGAISGSGASIAGVNTFSDLIGYSDPSLFDSTYAGTIENIITDVTSSAQYRNFPKYDAELVVSGSYTTEPFLYFYRSTAEPGSGDATSGAACAKTSSLALTAQILTTSTSTNLQVGDLVYGVDLSLNIVTFVGQSEWYGIVTGPLGSYPDKVLQISNGGYILAITDCIGTGRVWSASGGSLNYPRSNVSSLGTQNAALAAGGVCQQEKTEEYDGSSWSTGGVLIRPRFAYGAAGEQNAGLIFGGYGAPNGSARTEEYDGTSWAAGGELNQFRYYNAGAGTQNAAITFGGYRGDSSFPNLTCTEEYNGTSWSTSNAMSVGRYGLAGGGIQNAAVAVGGTSCDTPAAGVCTEEYNGTSWSTGNASIVSKFYFGYAGTQNAGVTSGGSGPLACSEEYNGTSWSVASALPIKIQQHASNGTQTAAIATGGIVTCFGNALNTVTYHYG